MFPICVEPALHARLASLVGNRPVIDISEPLSRMEVDLYAPSLEAFISAAIKMRAPAFYVLPQSIRAMLALEYQKDIESIANFLSHADRVSALWARLGWKGSIDALEFATEFASRYPRSLNDPKRDFSRDFLFPVERPGLHDVLFVSQGTVHVHHEWNTQAMLDAMDRLDVDMVKMWEAEAALLRADVEMARAIACELAQSPVYKFFSDTDVVRRIYYIKQEYGVSTRLARRIEARSFYQAHV